MLRRGNHEGTFRERDGGVWEGSVTIDGQRHYVRAKTQAEARRRVAAVRQAHSVGELVAPSKTTLSQHLRAWLAAGEADWKPKTHHEYEEVVRVYLEPVMGRRKVQDLTAPMVTAAYANWRKERGIAGGTLLNVHRILHRALTSAVRQGLVGRNVADVVLPKAVRKRPELWSLDEAMSFLNCEPDGRWGALWAVLLGTGCRLGEALGLTWADVDREQRCITIDRSLTYVGGVPVLSDPKTAAGRRTVTVPPFALSRLRGWRAEQASIRLALGSNWFAGDRVFDGFEGAEFPGYKAVQWAFRRTEKRAALREVRIHDLRHLHASVLLGNGMDLPAVSARLGHASPAITASVYSHVLKGRDHLAADVIEQALASASGSRTA